MQLHLQIRLASPLTLPINYNHIQQAAVYNLLSGEEGLSDFAHNQGYTYGNRAYRIFCFSPLKGDYQISDKRITFQNKIDFEIRSNNNIFIYKIFESLKEEGIILGHADIDKLDVSLTDKVIMKDSVRIRMKSPITVFSSEAENGEKQYRNPQEGIFYSLIEDNFVRKYAAFYGAYPKTQVSISPVEQSAYKKFVTYYQKSPIVGWYGDFFMEGDPGYLSFLYNSGIGSKNAQGFGMFDECD